MTDSELIELLFARDEAAISGIEQSYGAYMLKIAMNILGSPEDGREAVNDVLLKVWDTIPPLRPERLSAYIAKLVRNSSISAYRKMNSAKRRLSQYAVSLSEAGEAIPDASTPETAAEAGELKELIDRFVSGLNADERALFLGRYYFFDPLKDAAAYTGMSVSKAKSMLRRLRLRLKAFLEKEGYPV
ncbi:MAG: sigma-70 family RNA polymerase sigma factor [Clostridia bacterium]|nr:sigma-70 family RNA polymerase sigma factor [Clostridia bacterium]